MDLGCVGERMGVGVGAEVRICIMDTHDSLRLEVCDNPLVLVPFTDDMDEFAEPRYARKHNHGVSFEYESAKTAAELAFADQVAKLPAWMPLGSWVPEEAVPMPVQVFPVTPVASLTRPAEVVATPIKNITPSRDGMRSTSDGVHLGGGDHPVPAEGTLVCPTPNRPVLPAKTIVQRVLEKGRRREIEMVCVQVAGAQQSFHHWSIRLDGEVGGFFLLWCWSSRAKTHDFLGRLEDARLWTVMRGSPGQTFVVPLTLVGSFGCLVRPNGAPEEVMFVAEYEYVNDEVPVALDEEAMEEIVSVVAVAPPEKIKSPKLSRTVAEPVPLKRRLVEDEEGPDPRRRERSSRLSSPDDRSYRSGRSSRASSRERRPSRDRRPSERQGRSPVRDWEPRSDDIFLDFTQKSTRVRSVTRTQKKLPANYRKTPTSKEWTVSGGQTFEMFCREIWTEAQTYDRGMDTFADMVGARIPSHVRGRISKLLTLRGEYRDPVTKFRIPDLSRTNPVAWLRAVTPLVDPDVTGERRLAGARKYRQKEDEPFHIYLDVVWQSMLMSGIHLGWTRNDLRRNVLEAFGDGLNTRCHILWQKEYGADQRDASRYDEITAYIDRMDRIERDPRSKAAESYCHMIRDGMQPKGTDTAKEAVNVAAHSRSAEGDDAKIPAGRRALHRENRALANRIAALEKGAGLNSAPVVVAAAAPAAKANEKVTPGALIQCPHCPRPHRWSVERCFNNPDCVVPVADRPPRRPRTAKVAAITDVAPAAPK